MTTSDDDRQADARATVAGERSRGLTPAMKYTLWAVGGVVVIGIVIAIILSISSPSTQPGSAPTQSGSPAADGGSNPGASPGATPVEGSEVIPPAPTATAPGGLPAVPATEPLVKAPLPKSASADGKLVAGYPEDVMGPAPDSDILSSSVATEGTTMQVTLTARTDSAQEDVTEHFRTMWEKLGLTEIPQTDGSANLAYSNEFTSLTLGYSAASGTGNVYTLYGVFRTE